MLGATIANLLFRLKNQKSAAQTPPNDVLINVNRLTEKAGAAYEKLRYLVDYKDDRHIRRSATERIIKRKLIFEGGAGLGLALIQELIAGRYLPNNAIPESSAQAVEKIIAKYKNLETMLPSDIRGEARTRNILASLMGSEIDEFFYPNNEDEFTLEAFFATVKDSVKVDADCNLDFVQIQVRIACYRCLLNVDDETLRYKLWLLCVPDWRSLENRSDIEKIAAKAQHLWNSIQAELADPLSFKILPKLGNYGIYFGIIREVIRVYGAESEQIFGKREALDQFTREFLEKNYKKQYGKARGSALRAVAYIFFTKTLVALALELPYQLYFLDSVEYFPIVTNIVFHPLLLFFMTVSLRKLGDENTKAVQAGVNGILSGEPIRLIKVGVKQAGFFNTIFLVFYSAMFLVVFGAIIFGLKTINFSDVSILLFLCFLALVSYFALRIRHSAKRLKVAREESRTISLAFNLFTLPIVRAGRWLSRRFSSINVFVFVLDFIIETPFKMLLHVGDAFVSFLKEKQEDVY